MIRRLNSETPYIEGARRKAVWAEMEYNIDTQRVTVWIPPTPHIIHRVISDLQWVKNDLSDRMISLCDTPYTIPTTEFLLSQTCLPACLDLWPPLKSLMLPDVNGLLDDDRVTHKPYELQPYDMSKLDHVTAMVVTHSIIFKDADSLQLI